MATLIHDLLKLPQSVRKGDFVQDLAGGVADPQRTVDTYAITPKIVDSFRHALSIVDSALRDRRSQASYLHGSFGAGKSHFMALMLLMLDDHPTPWSRKEFHELRTRFDWIGKKKLLQLPIHMLGAENMESKILGTYVRWVRSHHPDAPVPPVFRDQMLFDDARRLRESIGDEAFFSKLNVGSQQAAAGWGKLGASRRWDAARFEATLVSTVETERDGLFSDLVKSWFQAFGTQTSRFVDLDEGLGVMSRHAKDLGYDGIVLYLDELVLWLAGRSGNLDFIGQETQKMVKLKEAQDAQRDIPIVSFIARQRDLAQFLGDQAEGAVRAELARNMGHHEGRFETVTLADSNLPAIVQHRVVMPKDAHAAEVMKDGFAKTWRAAGQAKSVLIGSEGDEVDFGKVFPFSPALVEALVALSDCLQRERTAIRILMEMLVDHLPELELGPVVPVGDLYDVIAGGEDPVDDPVMKARFERAKQLYEERFLPLIRSKHNTESPEKCQRLRENHDTRLGCSRCPLRACRTDNRLAKTLLLAALVPEAKPFKGLTMKRVVHLNHGTIATPIPDTEAQIAAQRVREWASQIAPLRIGDQADPEVGIHLSGIDLEPILAGAAELDQAGARRQKLREILFNALSLPTDTTMVDTKFTYRGTHRPGRVHYGNVRELPDERLTLPPDLEWLVVIDYPFDVGHHTPEDDIRRLETFRDGNVSTRNAVAAWIPHFFSHQLEKELGDLVVIDHVLDDAKKYLGHLRVEDQNQAKTDLASLAAQKRDKISRTLAKAYGITAVSNDPLLDASRSADEHVVSLLPGLSLRTLLAGKLRDGFDQIATGLLSHRYPHHPAFDTNITAGKLELIKGTLEKLFDQVDYRLPIDATQRKELRAIADPLGITSTTETAVVLNEDTFKAIDQLRQQAGMHSPKVSDARPWIDPGTRGLQPEVADLVLWAYAQWAGRLFVLGSKPAPMGKLGQFLEDAELQRPLLPSQSEWSDALARAGKLFGITLSKVVNPRNLSAFCARLREALDEKVDKTRRVEASAAYVKALEVRIVEWSTGPTADRVRTARSAEAVLKGLDVATGAAQVQLLASATLETSLDALARSITAMKGLQPIVGDDNKWSVFQLVRDKLGDPAVGHRAQAILDDLSQALAMDELNRPLAEAHTSLTARAWELVRKQPPPPPPPPKPDWEELHREDLHVLGAQYAAELERIAQAFEARAGTEAGELRLTVSVSLERKR